MFTQQQSFTPNDVFLLEHITYIPLGNQNPMYNRPMTVNANEYAINKITEHMLSTGANTVSSNIVADVVTGIIQPSAVAQASVIDNMWVTTPRFCFILKVNATDPMGINMNYYLQGFTDHNGITPTGHVDPKLLHTVNSVIETTNIDYTDPVYGHVRKEKLFRTYTVHGAMSDEYYVQRPSDIVENMGLMELTNNMGYGGPYGGVVEVEAQSHNNLVSRFNNNIVASASNNGVATNYLTKVLNEGIMKKANNDLFVGSFDTVDNTNKTSDIIEVSPHDNRFLKYISSMRGFMSVRNDFTYFDLLSMDNTVDQRARVLHVDDNRTVLDMYRNTPEVGEYWHGQDPVTIKAYSIMEAASSIVPQFGYNSITLTATNMADATGMANVIISDGNSYTNVDDASKMQLLEMIRQKFLTDVFLPETNGGVIDMYLELYVDIIGTTKIYLQYAGYPGSWYTAPTAAKSLFSQQITFNRDTLDAATQQFSTLVDNVVSNNPGASYTAFAGGY